MDNPCSGPGATPRSLRYAIFNGASADAPLTLPPPPHPHPHPGADDQTQLARTSRLAAQRGARLGHAHLSVSHALRQLAKGDTRTSSRESNGGTPSPSPARSRYSGRRLIHSRPPPWGADDRTRRSSSRWSSRGAPPLPPASCGDLHLPAAWLRPRSARGTQIVPLPPAPPPSPTSPAAVRGTLQMLGHVVLGLRRTWILIKWSFSLHPRLALPTRHRWGHFGLTRSRAPPAAEPPPPACGPRRPWCERSSTPHLVVIAPPDSPPWGHVLATVALIVQRGSSGHDRMPG
jgi:hypothetical protein